jgi:F-type H+-transporting ATPase subunit b
VPSMFKVARSISAFTVAVLFAAAPVFAQEGGGATDTPTGQIFKIINSALVVGGIAFALVYWAGPLFRKHSDEISSKIAEGTRAREAAEAKQREIRVKMAGLPMEVEQLRVSGKREAELEAQRLRDAAKADAQKIEKSAQVEVNAAIRAGQMKLKQIGAEKAIAQAEALLRREITPQADANLVHKFVAELDRSVN